MVTQNDFVRGDGGPIIVLQASVASQWLGARDWDNALMNGGNVETDYDAICEIESSSYVIKRYDRDMLVLDDSEWGAYLFTLSSGSVVVVQQFAGDGDINAVVERIMQKRPSKSFTIDVQDSSLRLLVGAENGRGQIYGYKDVPIEPGIKRCDVFSSSAELVVIINSARTLTS